MSAEINDPEPVMVQDGVEKEDPDPVTAEYNVYLTPSDETQQLYLLQYPNRSRKDTFRRHAFPAAMRIKPSSGFMEMDLPVHFTNFDRAKGVRWGEALRQAKEEGISGFGVAGGFANITQGKHGALKMKPPKPRAAGIEDGDMEIDGEDGDQDEMDKLLENFEDSVEKGHVLSQQTLGGQILKSEAGKPVYMLGAFRESMFSCFMRVYTFQIN